MERITNIGLTEEIADGNFRISGIEREVRIWTAVVVVVEVLAWQLFIWMKLWRPGAVYILLRVSEENCLEVTIQPRSKHLLLGLYESCLKNICSRLL